MSLSTLLASAALFEIAPQTSDSYRVESGVRSFSATYRESYRLGRREPHYARAALEDFALLGIGVAWYWYQRDYNRVDWDYASVQSRFKHLEITFDSNSGGMNFFGHPFSGAFLYAAARRNGLNIAESFGYAVASSTAYEFLHEWREKPSVNDLIMTPFGGLAIGEFLVHLGDYATSAMRLRRSRRGVNTRSGPRNTTSHTAANISACART
jgi:hypothetical protein